MRKAKAAKTELVQQLKERKSRLKGRLETLASDNPGDLSIVLLTVILVVFGTVMIFSASYYKSISDVGDPYVYLKRQIFWALVGFVVMWWFSRIDYHVWGQNFYIIAPVVCLILLGLVFTPLGLTVNGATRWIGIGPVTVMPGELSKVGLIFFISGFYGRNSKRVLSFASGVYL